ncbi:hypothetical protein U1Q18_022746 [Sarracenia purpurea var. burkii]
MVNDLPLDRCSNLFGYEVVKSFKEHVKEASFDLARMASLKERIYCLKGMSPIQIAEGLNLTFFPSTNPRVMAEPDIDFKDEEAVVDSNSGGEDSEFENEESEVAGDKTEVEQDPNLEIERGSFWWMRGFHLTQVGMELDLKRMAQNQALLKVVTMKD